MRRRWGLRGLMGEDTDRKDMEYIEKERERIESDKSME